MKASLGKVISLPDDGRPVWYIPKPAPLTYWGILETADLLAPIDDRCAIYREQVLHECEVHDVMIAWKPHGV